VTVRSHYWLAAALGLTLLSHGPGWAQQQPPPPPSTASSAERSNQDMAEAIAARLRQSPLLRNYELNVGFAGGIAELQGDVTQPAQHDEALRIARDMPGVQKVIDHVRVAAAPADIVPVQAPSTLPVPPAPVAPPPGAVPPPAPAPAPVQEAVPAFQAPAATPHDLNPPRMPPYAWPSYAPYNNYSRVCYPTAYPYNAWPFIGPIYPFPKVPLGWRAVQLEWQDGYWWYSKLMTKYDWWRLRFY
jgi:hypothetical protein